MTRAHIQDALAEPAAADPPAFRQTVDQLGGYPQVDPDWFSNPWPAGRRPCREGCACSGGLGYCDDPKKLAPATRTARRKAARR